MPRAALASVVLQLAFVHAAFATSDDWALVDDSGLNMVTCTGGAQSGSGSQLHLHLQINGEPLNTTLHRVPPAFSHQATITIMRGDEVVKSVPASSIDTPTYSNEDGSAVFSIVGEVNDPEVDGIVLGSDGVMHVHAKGAVQLELNIVLTVGQVVIQQGGQGAPAWDDPNCQLGLSSQLGKLREWQPPSQQGVWHLFDDCLKFGSSRHAGLATMKFDPPGTICMMDPVPGHNEYWNTAVSWYSSNTWKTFAHEVGHNFGGHHSFEKGQGKTGGIMDYGDGKLDGEYQFNTKYRKDQICKSIDKVIGSCSAFSSFNPGTGTTTTTSIAPHCKSPCEDALSVTKTITVNGVKFSSCATLISNANSWLSWCSNFDVQVQVCVKTCGACPDCGDSTSTTNSVVTTSDGVTTTSPSMGRREKRSKERERRRKRKEERESKKKEKERGCDSPCQDLLGSSKRRIRMNGVKYTDCATLISQASTWCSYFESQVGVCKKTCGLCPDCGRRMQSLRTQSLRTSKPADAPTTTSKPTDAPVATMSEGI